MWLSLVENLFFSVLNRCAAVQIKQYWDCSTLWINWEGTMCFTLVYNLFLLFSTGAQLCKENNMGSVLPYRLTGKVLCGLA